METIGSVCGRTPDQKMSGSKNCDDLFDMLPWCPRTRQTVSAELDMRAGVTVPDGTYSLRPPARKQLLYSGQGQHMVRRSGLRQRVLVHSYSVVRINTRSRTQRPHRHVHPYALVDLYVYVYVC